MGHSTSSLDGLAIIFFGMLIAYGLTAKKRRQRNASRPKRRSMLGLFIEGALSSTNKSSSTYGSSYGSTSYSSSSYDYEADAQAKRARDNATYLRNQANQAAYYNSNSFDAQAKNNYANQAEWNARR